MASSVAVGVDVLTCRGSRFLGSMAQESGFNAKRFGSKVSAANAYVYAYADWIYLPYPSARFETRLRGLAARSFVVNSGFGSAGFARSRRDEGGGGGLGGDSSIRCNP